MVAPYESFHNFIIKSPADWRSCRILHLANGLCAVLVHDAKIYAEAAKPARDDADGDKDSKEEKKPREEADGDDGNEEFLHSAAEEEGKGGGGSEEMKKAAFVPRKAAAAMCVGMGSFADPYKAQGLAHFLEHMLFMGSSEFPDENEYDRYLSKHGGSSNAYTKAEYTCYHFNVHWKHLKGALRRFSQFFISPLMKEEAMAREVLVVDSEFNKVLQSDSCRLLQLQCHTSSRGHAFNRFFWGNKKSLIDVMAYGVNLREEILKMYAEHYCGVMNLVVIGGEPLDILEEWVVELFSSVKAREALPMFQTTNLPIWKAGKLYRLEAVKDVHILELTWTLPCLHKEYLKKPTDYLAHLMGNQGKGSLLYFLKAKGLENSLSPGIGDEGMHRSSIAYIFIMSIYLTDSGFAKLYDVIGYVYQYIKLLRDATPQEWVFKELQDIGNLKFTYPKEQPQDSYALHLAENMLFYPEKHIIYGEYAFEQWDPELVGYVLSFFSPDNMRADIVSKSFDKNSEAIQVEPWFGPRYIEADISPSLLQLWSNPPEIDPSLHFPLKIEFIPSDFSLRKNQMLNALQDANRPRCIIDQPFIKFWYMSDLIFNVPHANAYFLITLKDGYSSLRNCVLTELFVNLLQDELNEIIYQLM